MKTLPDLKSPLGSSHCGSVVMNPTNIHEDEVWSLASLSGLRIQCCCVSCGVGHRCSSDLALLWLCCRLAAAAHNSTPSLGTSIWSRCTPPRKSKKKKNQKLKTLQPLTYYNILWSKQWENISQNFCLSWIIFYFQVKFEGDRENYLWVVPKETIIIHL